MQNIIAKRERKPHKYQAAILVMQSFQKPMELQTFAIQEGIVLPFSSLSSHHNETKKQ